ncbi:rho guanine nucleotide exchange factor 12 isoform 1-T1 [Synchiropus picturatus]
MQSTLTDRTPNILNKDSTEKKQKHENSIFLKHEFDPTGLVQRCVIIQRDENGFGLTVSGDNPVFVQLVKKDGAAMRAGVQTGDRIIKVNGTFVTHSNHIEVVKLIKSGSYVALTVLGRPPGLPQIPLEEEEGEEEVEEEEGDKGEEDKEVSSQLCREKSEDVPPPTADEDESNQDDEDQTWTSCADDSTCAGSIPESPGTDESPNINLQDGRDSCPVLDSEDDVESRGQCIVGNPPYLLHPQIIGAEDDYFESQQEQIPGQSSCFQNVHLLKTRPAHLAVFLHHVVSQFDPAPLLCFLFADLHLQTSSRESRRFFPELHSLFLDRTANLKVLVPEHIAAELEKRRLELIPEDQCKLYTQMLQDSLLPDLNKNLEDFRQKRSMGLTLAETELSKLDLEAVKDAVTSERECCCAENILSKIEDILLASPPAEEEKCQTMQYVIHTVMKHLGVKVKEVRGLEQKRPRINFLPKIKQKSIRPEKEGEEKVKRPRFPSILGPQRRLSRVDSTSGAVGKALELNKQRSPKLLSQTVISIPETSDAGVGSGRVRGNLLSDGSDSSAQLSPFTTSPTNSAPSGQTSDTSGQDSDPNVSPFPHRSTDGLQSSDLSDGGVNTAASQFDFSPSNVEQLQDEENFRAELSCSAPADVQSEEDVAGDVEGEDQRLNWQSLVSRDVLATLTPQEINRQEVINELLYTERAHLRTLKVLDQVFYQRLSRDSVLPPEDIRGIFMNLEEIVQLHISISEQMASIRKRNETFVIGHIGDDLLSWFGGDEEEKIIKAVGTFCSNQPSALEFIKSRKKKDPRFCLFMQEAERNRLCRRLQLKDIIPVVMQRFTKYPLLLENIAKYSDDGEEKEKVKKALECCKKILNNVNQAVKEAEIRQKLEDYQKRLDISSLKQSENPLILELKNLDLRTRRLVHEGPLTWKVNKDKTIELYTILLEDVLVLLQKQDERLVLKLHGKNVVNVADTKHIFSPVIKLNTVLVRSVATNNKSFFVLSMSENGAQIYELTAQSVSDQRTWQRLITQCADAMKAKPHSENTPSAGRSQAEQAAIDIIESETSEASKDDAASEGALPPPVALNPFDGLRSEDEAEEEVDEAELEAFLDGQLADTLPFLQERSRRAVALENPDSFCYPESKAEEALRTLLMLKDVLFSHMISRDQEKMVDQEENKTTEGPEAPPAGTDEDQAYLQQDDAQMDSCGVQDPSAGSDDDCGGDAGIDMRKLLSSSSQTDGGGPDLSRQLMTHLRLLQADLQYLKEVEAKYIELQQKLTPNGDGIH